MARYNLPMVKDYGKEGQDSSLREEEHGDCTVRSLMNSMNVSYNYAHEILRLAGRKNGKGFYMTEFLHKCMDGNSLVGYYLKEMHFQNWYPGAKMTIRKFVEKYNKGRFIVIRKGHAFAVIDGVIHDSTWNTPNMWIHHAFRVVEPQPIEE